MKRRLLIQLLLCTACTGVVAVLETNSTTGPRHPDIDYRYYSEDGQLKWCVYCTEEDFTKNYAESECFEKQFHEQLAEQQEWRGKNTTFYPLCGSLLTDPEYFRYIKNCTAPPTIEGATVNCTDQDGRQLYRVHDTCRVSCTIPHTRPSSPVTTCDPWIATWTHVACVPDACPQLSYIVKDNEKTTCNVSQWLPINTTCEITCPEGYTPDTREMVCTNGKWKAIRTCAPESGGHVLKVILFVIGGLLFMSTIVLILVIVWWKKWRPRCKNSTGSKDPEDKAEAVRLITTPSGSSTTGSVCQASVATPSEVDETSFTTDDTISTESKVEGEGSRADDPPPPYTSQDVMQDNMGVVVLPSYDKGNLAAVNVCDKVEIFYKRTEEDPGCRLPFSCELQASAGSRLTLYAVCGNLDRIVQFNFGPYFIGDTHESLETGVRLNVTKDTHGNYLLCAKCSQGGEVVLRVFIRVTDNPDETYVKELFREQEFDSFNSTESGHNMSGGGGPSKSLEAAPFSLPSNPSLGKELISDSEEEEDCLEAGGGDREVGGAIDEVGGALGGTDNRLGPAISSLSLASRCTQNDDENDSVRSCSLLLTELQGRRHKKLLDKLVLKLEPLDSRSADTTIFGATLSILGFSEDRVEHVVWAKRNDLRNTPARVLLSMMMQAGKRGGHLVRYFSNVDHHNTAVVRILKHAHPDCPFCQGF